MTALQHALDTAHKQADGTCYLAYDWTQLSRADNPQSTIERKVKACGYTLVQYGDGINGKYMVVRKDNHEDQT